MSRRPGSAPLALATAATAVVVALHSSDVGFRDMVTFAAVQLVGYVVPGVLLWRALRGRASSWLHDVTFGTILAHAVTIGVYLPARAAGVPQAVWAVPVVTVAAFLAVPSLRPYWRGSRDEAEPAWLVWGLTACVVLLCAWFGGLVSLNPLVGPAVAWQSGDYTFLLALAGEVRNHVPPTTPFVVDERLNYHWFTMVDTAALSWQGGQSLAVLMFRLLPLWCLVHGFVAFGQLAARIAGRRGVGLLAVVIAVLVGSVNLFHGANTYVVDDTLLLVNWVGSPTQGFGQLLAMAVLFVVVGLLRGEDRGPRAWVLFTVLSLALMGAKATFIPVIGAGVAVVLVVEVLRRRRIPRTALGVGAILAAELAFAQIVLFGGASQGLVFSAGGDLRRLGDWIGVPATTGTLPLVAVASCLLFGWVAPLLGALLLFLPSSPDGHRPALRDPAVHLLAGMVVSSLAVVLVLAHPGYSEYFFLRSGLPFGYILTAWGLAVAFERLPRRVALAVLALAFAWGAGFAFLSRTLTRPDVSPHEAAVRAALLAAAAVAVAGLAAVAGFAGARRAPCVRMTVALGCLAASTVGMGAVRTADLVAAFPVHRPDVSSLPVAQRPIPRGGIAAAEYVRERSSPDEMLATNAHCHAPRTNPCDVRSFWVSAFSERRVVIEGWGYTATANDTASTRTGSFTIPYWNQPLLRLNDAAFEDPSAATIDALSARYPVRWLVVDRRFGADLPRLRRILPDNRRFQDVVVFRLPRGDLSGTAAGRFPSHAPRLLP